jgi:pilus assembly protein CpaE
MKPLHTGIIISPTQEPLNGQAEHLAPMVEITRQFSSFDQGHHYLKANPAGIAFLDISHNREQGLKWTRKIKKSVPETRLFLMDQSPTTDTILAGFRNGALDFLPISGTDTGRLLERVKAALDRDGGQEPQGELITLFSLKGGVGLTTTAINLADQISQLTREKVLLLDLNLFMGDITGYLDIHPQFTPYDLVADIERMDGDLLFSSLFRHDRGFYVLTALEEINDSDSIGTQDMAAMLDLLKSQFDYIVAEAPHDFSRRTLALVDRTDRLLVMAQQNLPCIKSIQKIMEFLSDIRLDPQKLAIVLNRHLKSGELTRTDLENSFGRKIDYCICNDYPACLKAANRGSTLGQASGTQKITRQISAMAQGITGVAQESPTGLKAFLTWIKP